jgi:Xaa-Pro aminopeptidase
MLTVQGCKSRRDRLFAALPSPCDFLVIGDPSHLVYFANYVPSPFEFRTVESSAILILEPTRSTLIADNLLQPYLEKAHVDEVVAPTWYDGSKPTSPRRSQLVESTLTHLEKVSGGRIGVEFAAVPCGVIEGLVEAARIDVDLLDISPIIRPLRRAKDADEVAVLKRAMRAGEAAHAAAFKEMKPGMTELDAYLVVQNAAMKELGERVIVYGDFASGPRTATDKGGPPTSRVIEAGDLLLLDYSVVVDGYRTDFTNTFAVGGGPTPRQREMFEACVGALKAAEGKLKAGTPGGEIDAAVRAHFGSLGLADHFVTHTGHGIGLGHPEPPYLVPNGPEKLVVGDVIAVEPGLYIEGVGGMRFERNYLITAEGFETLSNHEIRIEQ